MIDDHKTGESIVLSMRNLFATVLVTLMAGCVSAPPVDYVGLTVKDVVAVRGDPDGVYRVDDKQHAFIWETVRENMTADLRAVPSTICTFTYFAERNDKPILGLEGWTVVAQTKKCQIVKVHYG